MASIEKQASRSIEPTGTNRGLGLAGAVVGLLVAGLILAVAWVVFWNLVGIIALGFRIAVILGIILVALVLVGMIRVHVLKR